MLRDGCGDRLGVPEQLARSIACPLRFHGAPMRCLCKFLNGKEDAAGLDMLGFVMRSLAKGVITQHLPIDAHCLECCIYIQLLCGWAACLPS